MLFFGDWFAPFSLGLFINLIKQVLLITANSTLLYSKVNDGLDTEFSGNKLLEKMPVLPAAGTLPHKNGFGDTQRTPCKQEGKTSPAQQSLYNRP